MILLRIIELPWQLHIHIYLNSTVFLRHMNSINNLELISLRVEVISFHHF